MIDLFFTNVAHAESVDQFIANVDRLIINPLILLLFALAVVYFLYGVFEFIANGANEEKKTAGKSHMLWGVVGIGIMMAVFTILQLVMNTLNIKGIDPEQGTVELDNFSQ